MKPNKKSKKADISNVEEQVKKNVQTIQKHNKIYPYLLAIALIIGIFVFIFRFFTEKSLENVPLIVVVGLIVIFILLIILVAYVIYRIYISAMNRSIKTMEKMHRRLKEDVKQGKKYSKTKAKIVLSLVILLLFVVGLSIVGIGLYAMFNQVGITTMAGAVKIALFGAGITAIGIYALIVYMRNRHLLNNPRYYY